MRTSAIRAFVAGLSLVALPLAGQTRAELEKVIRRSVLPNGLEVIVVENHGVPIATVEIDVKNGSFTQSPEYPEPEAFTVRSTELGAQFNGSTREEVVNYYLTLPADSARAGMRFLASAL